MINKNILLVCLLLFASRSESGVLMLTIHSRANCINNESISWDMRWFREYYTLSLHSGAQDIHILNTGWENTWRSAAVHWSEALPGAGWRVVGPHWMKDPNTGEAICLGTTDVVDCSIYDGWWDH